MLLRLRGAKVQTSCASCLLSAAMGTLCWETASCGNPRLVAEAGGLSLERHCRCCSNLGVRIDMAVTSDWKTFLLKS